jgi:hypothetical protein
VRHSSQRRRHDGNESFASSLEGLGWRAMLQALEAGDLSRLV